MAVRRTVVCVNNVVNSLFQLRKPHLTKASCGEKSVNSLKNSVLLSSCSQLLSSHNQSTGQDCVNLNRLGYSQSPSVLPKFASPNVRVNEDLCFLSSPHKLNNYNSMRLPKFRELSYTNPSQERHILTIARQFSTALLSQSRTVLRRTSAAEINISCCRMKHTIPKVPPTRMTSVYDIERAVTDEEAAKQFVYALKASERKYLYEELARFHGETAVTATVAAEGPPTRQELKLVALHQMFPFIGFGFLDNFLMIVAGEYIDVTLGTTLGISTMAAAAIGNWFSDICGLGSAHYVERFVAKFGIRHPHLSPTQVDMKSTKWASNLGKAIGVTIGCFLGMIPLLFFGDEKSNEDCKDKASESTPEPSKQTSESTPKPSKAS